jgi:hypothetical protein
MLLGKILRLLNNRVMLLKVLNAFIELYKFFILYKVLTSSIDNANYLVKVCSKSD